MDITSKHKHGNKYFLLQSNLTRVGGEGGITPRNPSQLATDKHTEKLLEFASCSFSGRMAYNKQ